MSSAQLLQLPQESCCCGKTELRPAGKVGEATDLASDRDLRLWLRLERTPLTQNPPDPLACNMRDACRND